MSASETHLLDSPLSFLIPSRAICQGRGPRRLRLPTTSRNIASNDPGGIVLDTKGLLQFEASGGRVYVGRVYVGRMYLCRCQLFSKAEVQMLGHRLCRTCHSTLVSLLPPRFVVVIHLTHVVQCISMASLPESRSKSRGYGSYHPPFYANQSPGKYDSK